LLSEQQAAQMYNFEGKHQRYLASMQYKTRVGYLTITTTHFSQRSLHKIRWSSGSLASGRIQPGTQANFTLNTVSKQRMLTL